MAKWYWAVGNDNAAEDPLVVTDYDLNGYDEWDFSKGQWIDGWDSNAWFRAEEDGNPDDVLQSVFGPLCPMFSARLQEALVEARIQGIQFLPIRVLRPDGEPIPGYAIANVLNLVPALDLERSTVEFWGMDRPDRTGQVKAIHRMVLKRSKLSGHDILRLREYPLNVIVSDNFVRLFREQGFTGYSFHERILSDG